VVNGETPGQRRAMAVGRISGPLLKANLLRDGVDLAFETDLLYLDVVNSRVGIKTATPLSDLPTGTVGLDINGTTRTAKLEATTEAKLATFTLLGNTIYSSSSTINLTPQGSNPVVYQGTIVVDQLEISGNTVASTGTNTNLEITAGLGGTVNINSNVEVFGNLHATGDITANGNITLGNEVTDNVVFGADVNSNILPNIDNTYSLGSPTQRWATVYSNVMNIGTINSTNYYTDVFQTSGIEITGNTISSRVADTDINFITTGTGGVQIGNFNFLDNTITNTVSGAVSLFEETGTGYTKFAGTNGVVIPVGLDTERPSNAVTGMIRFNTQQALVEVYNGIGWTSVAGTSSGVTFNDATEIGIGVVLTLG
jgi:hypothetical protein